MPYAYYMWLSLVSFACVCLFCVPSCVATMSFAGYSLVRCLLSAFPATFFSERVPGLIWFGSVYLVTTAGFAADQLMRDKQQQTDWSRIISPLLGIFISIF